MASGKPSAKDKPSITKRKRLPLDPGRAKKKKIKNKPTKSSAQTVVDDSGETYPSIPPSLTPSAAEQLSFFLDQFQSTNGIKLSSLELESIKDTCMVELSKGLSQDASNLGNHIMDAFGTSWKEVLSEGNLVEGKIDPGCPAVLVISSSALRSLELLRGLRSVTKECPAVKLFSKHIKVEDQVSLLKNRVNIASGTPSRINKLCEMEALGLSRLTVLVLDMQTDAKGYSLFTLPQVRSDSAPILEPSVPATKAVVLSVTPPSCVSLSLNGMSFGNCIRTTSTNGLFKVTCVFVYTVRFLLYPARAARNLRNQPLRFVMHLL